MLTEPFCYSILFSLRLVKKVKKGQKPKEEKTKCFFYRAAVPLRWREAGALRRTFVRLPKSHKEQTSKVKFGQRPKEERTKERTLVLSGQGRTVVPLR